MADRVVLFDFDGTLLNTGYLTHELLWSALATAAQTEQSSIEEVYQAYKQTLTSNVEFDPSVFLQLVADQTHAPLQLLTDHFYQPEYYQQAVYPETRAVVEQVKQKYPVGVFTQGVPTWQKRKLDLAELTPLFEPALTFIASRKTTPQFLSKLPKPCIIIDDNLEIITTLQYQPDIAPIFLDRSGQSTDPNHLHSLTDVLAMI